MGESERYLDYKHHKPRRRFTLGQDNNAIVALFVINVLFFLLLLTIQVGFYFGEQTTESFYKQIVQWFSLPAGLTKLSERPWTILTYMFSETSGMLFRLFGNMVWLWSFGYILQEMAGNDKIIPVYLYGGFLGAVFFIAANYFLPAYRPFLNESSLLGANAAVMSIATATTTLSPDYRIFRHIRKGMPVWVLFVFYVLIDFAGVSSNTALMLSHLGGAVAGFLFVVLLRKGWDGSLWMNKAYHRLVNLFTPSKTSDRQLIKEKIFYQTGDRKPFDKQPNVTQQRIDELLDKINEKGYHFLTEEEKQFLKKASEEENI